MVLLSAEEAGVVVSFAPLLRSADESDKESLELESDSGSGVVVAVLRVFLSFFLARFFSGSEESDEESVPESALESDDDELSAESVPDSEEPPLSLSEDSESEVESSESDSDEGFSALEDTFAFFNLGASSSESEFDSEELDSTLRFKPAVGLGAGARAGASSSSSSSSASLSELEEADEDDGEFGEEADPGDFLFRTFGASFISTSESLASSELLSLSPSLLSVSSPLVELLDELGLADRFAFVSLLCPSQILNRSSNGGTFAWSA